MTIHVYMYSLYVYISRRLQQGHLSRYRATTSGLKKLFLSFKFLKLTEKNNFFTCSIMDNIILLHIDYSYSLYLYMYILNICCSALRAGKGRGGSVNAMLAKHITQKCMA